ncbi:hypothetical protein JKP88DRAFT_321170 [Tribonema minus]|uniref:Glycosyltransferase 2-like domain-containing protein n=1 Tax=Tribonema minus TaxID=303371 RepID=A0A836CDB2_9STRA|nr:hypothetical protein JKP88DRAFT_321170 [Tribonema minus]
MDPSVFANIASFLGTRGTSSDAVAPPPASVAPAPSVTTRRQPGQILRCEPSPVVAPPHVHLVIFSRDRAFQLQQLLTTLVQCIDTAGLDLAISVLYLASDYHVRSYQHVKQLHPAVRFVEESPGTTCFMDLLAALVSSQGRPDSADDPSQAASFVWFAVDDMVFHAHTPFPLAAVTTLLHHDPRVFGAHLKLSPCITFSHAANAPCRVPQLQLSFTGSGGGASVDMFTYDRRSVAGAGPNDWDYPWDLTGGLYRELDVLAVLDGIRNLWQSATDAPPRPMNPNLLEFYGDKLLCSGAFTAAATHTMACVARQLLSAVTVNRVQTTFGTPVYAAGGCDVRALEALLWSAATVDVSCIRAQTLARWELIIVDDGSTDGSLSAVAGLISSDSRIHVVRSARREGVAAALMRGMRRATCDLIARMDADDVALPQRLARQCSSSACTSDGTDDISPSLHVQRFIQHPSDPAVLKWSLLFSCCVTHPTVVFRRSAVLAAGGYRPGDEPAEDYALWLRVAYAITADRSAAAAAALAAVTAALAPGRPRASPPPLLLPPPQLPPLPQHVAALRNPAAAASAADASAAAALLLSLAAAAAAGARAEGAGDEAAAIEADADARLGELAVASMQAFGGDAQALMTAWYVRCGAGAVGRQLAALGLERS